MTRPAPVPPPGGAGTVRLFTVQRARVLELFDDAGRYRAEWDAIGVSDNERKAYAHALSVMTARGLGDGRHPPVWAWAIDGSAVVELVSAHLSEAERLAHDHVVIELRVPPDQLLRSSFRRWCDLYFDCLETGAIDDDGRWLDWRRIDGDDTVQALLAWLERDWIVEVTPLDRIASDDPPALPR